MIISNIFTAGGIVMIPLLGFSVLGLALIVERLAFWIRINSRQKPVIREAIKLYKLDNIVGSVDKLHKNIDLPMARIFLAALALEDATPEEFRLALETEAQAEIPLLQRFNNVFETIISLSPLLGLLGTILGLISSFASLKIGDVGASKTTSVTAGISEALISTASGLIVAIFILLFANTFRGMYKRQLSLIQEYGGKLELLHRRRYQREKKSYISIQ